MDMRGIDTVTSRGAGSLLGIKRYRARRARPEIGLGTARIRAGDPGSTDGEGEVARREERSRLRREMYQISS